MDNIRTVTEEEADAIIAQDKHQQCLRRHTPSDFTDTEFTVTVIIYNGYSEATGIADQFKYRKKRPTR